MPELLELMNSLSDETRLNLVKLLLKHDFCVSALARRLFISESAVSQHLKVLRTASLVKGEKRGYFTHYTVNRELLRWAANELRVLSEIEKMHSSCPGHVEKEKHSSHTLGIEEKQPGKSQASFDKTE